MTLINENYLKLNTNYLFSEIARRAADYIISHPQKKLIKLGIGDATLPLPSSIISAMQAAVQDMGNSNSFRGYGPEQGYEFLRTQIAKHEYQTRSINISPSEIFISDGSKCDIGNILDIFGRNKIAVPDPSYPVYIDTNVMAGNTGSLQPNEYYADLLYLPCTPRNQFLPVPPEISVDLIYLCSPHNPTGEVMSRANLQAWVDYALANHAIILFDAAYERFIESPDIPRSIYEIEGGRQVAIEFRSFSKTAGFTGVRCAYTVIPSDLMGQKTSGEEISIHKLWSRRHSTKFNGVSYITQKGAEAVYTKAGQQEITQNILYYKRNAQMIREALESIGLNCWGGIESPYIWIQAPSKMTAWEFFDFLLHQAQVLSTPGSGFGSCGKGYIRLTGFGNVVDTQEAITRLQQIL